MVDRIAILSRRHLDTHPYDIWLESYDFDLLICAPDDEETRSVIENDPSRYKCLLFADWTTNWGIEQAIVREHRRDPFRSIVALSEGDQLRAADLRRMLEVDGPQPRSARAFRDKSTMKAVASAAGLDVPAFRRIDTIWDLVDFLKTWQGPVIIKPVDASGGFGVRLFNGPESAISWATNAMLPHDEAAGLIAEEFIDAPMYSVDGVADGGRIVHAMVLRYTSDCLTSLRQLRPHGVMTIDGDDPARVRALDYVECLLEAMPCPESISVFHCELFDDPSRGMLLCEIASRTGGGRINEIAQLILGIDLERWACLGQVGVVPDAVALTRTCATKLAGDAILLMPGHTLVRSPDRCPVDRVLDVQVHIRGGMRTSRALRVSDCAVDALFVGADAASLSRTYFEVVRWMECEFIWSGEDAT